MSNIIDKGLIPFRASFKKKIHKYYIEKKKESE
jgi:hypothetical protein